LVGTICRSPLLWAKLLSGTSSHGFCLVWEKRKMASEANTRVEKNFFMLDKSVVCPSVDKSG
jgi:hypothetical protein